MIEEKIEELSPLDHGTCTRCGAPFNEAKICTMPEVHAALNLDRKISIKNYVDGLENASGSNK